MQGHRLEITDDEGNFICINIELTSAELDLFREVIDNRSNCTTRYLSEAVREECR